MPPLRLLLTLLIPGLTAAPVALSAQPAAPATPLVSFTPPPPPRTYPRPVDSLLEAQIALARHGFSSGPIDGVPGAQTAAALRAFQQSRALPPTGRLDDATRTTLILETPPLTQLALTAADLADLQPTGKTWLEKSAQPALAHETALELVAERTHSSPRFIQALNPSIDWSAVTPGAILSIPAIALAPFPAKAARLEVRLAEHVLQAFDAAGTLLAHVPVSIAAKVEKRPVGELHVTIVIADPNYTLDPVNFPESAEVQALARKLILAPGPNNPVGVAWIGLDKPGYGIHGTPTPEHVGRTESHGCFRLANWDARTLLSLAWVGLPVTVVP
ncbi:MAG TPA: L,D-transpeptidase family protein [Rariglobus sp.]|nr:L,D-transpeptidase family protein [Rariglobus sp.]